MNYYAALDVSLRSVHLCVIDDQGQLITETKLSSEVTDIIAYLDDLDLEVSIVGLEAGTLAQYLTYGLQSAGFEVVCMEVRQVKAALSAMRNKTDKNDARGIAQLLRTGWYSKVHIKSMESHRVRALLSSRKAVLSKCICQYRSKFPQKCRSKIPHFPVINRIKSVRLLFSRPTTFLFGRNGCSYWRQAKIFRHQLGMLAQAIT